MLSEAESFLCDAVEAGETAVFKNQAVVRASVIRSIVLDLPVTSKSPGYISRKKERVIRTPAGIRMYGAKIEGRLDLRDAGGGDASACALEFCNCVFIGGFSGANGSFGRISFENCRFRDALPASLPDQALEIPAPIDLAGAQIEGKFNARNLHADREDDHLFIDATEARICGSVDLSRTRLKALPWQPGDSTDGSVQAALILTLARIEGDLNCQREFAASGSIRMRSTHVFGDIWMLGSEIGYSEEEYEKAPRPPDALFMQGLIVDGILNLCGWADNRDGSGVFRPFKATGEINLMGAKVAGSLHINDFFLHGSIILAQASVSGAISIASNSFPNGRISKNLHAEALNCRSNVTIGVQIDQFVDLGKCRIGGSLNISELRLSPVQGIPNDNLSLEDGIISGALILLVGDQQEAELITARTRKLVSLPGQTLVETLWRMERGGYSNDQIFQVGFICGKDSVIRLDGDAQRLHTLVERNGHNITSFEHAAEYLRLFCGYLQTNNGSFPIIADRNLLLPRAELDTEAIRQNLRRIEDGFDAEENDVKAAYQIAGEYNELSDVPDDIFAFNHLEVTDDKTRYRFEACVLYDRALFRSLFELHIVRPNMINVEMLEDRPTGIILTGVPIYKGAFIYPPVNATNVPNSAFLMAPALSDMAPVERSTNASFDRLAEQLSSYVQSNTAIYGKVNLVNLKCGALKDYGGSSWGNNVQISMNNFVYGSTQWNLPALRRHKGLNAWLNTLISDYAPRSILSILTFRQDRFRNRQRSAWRVRRDWIYQQFQAGSLFHLNPSRIDIAEKDYHPQPFEQIISVSRSEGHEEYATRFEIEKKNIEWRIARRRSHPALLAIALAAAIAWLVYHIRVVNATNWHIAYVLMAMVAVYIMTRVIKAFANFFRSGEQNLLARLSQSQRLALQQNTSRIMRLSQLKLLDAKQPVDEAMIKEKSQLEADVAAYNSNPSTRRAYWRAFRQSFVNATSRPPRLLTIALLFVTGWLLTRSANDLAVQMATSGALALAIIYLPDSFNLTMRFGFGYLRRPFRALLTLVLILFAGWWGVATANDSRMLVVDITPVAPLIREADGQIIIGGELISVPPGSSVAVDVHCGDSISEPLYALDVLIPLIDLRQESKCEVGIAQLPLNAQRAQKQSFKTLKRSETFWQVAKACYAILGWIVVSLVILTFVHVFRARNVT